ncbi:hypothetical protein ABFS82_10G158400 [Erythranthe guttata]|uniref:X8 domain-containing protein n=1 Tax=Erythranthe guttata TaxID=4155 RepID=A0A022PV40_ERYGU|nr:hypothetical protein MIMGU_mgv1a005260mg [Erythranthe guttata]
MGCVKMIRFACSLLAVILFAIRSEGSIGMNWGRQSAQRLIPSTVVDLLLQNGIGDARIYTSQPDILEAFAGSGINLTVQIIFINFIKTPQEAHDWIGQKIDPFFSTTNIRRVFIGNHEFKTAVMSGGNTSSAEAAVDLMETMQTALHDVYGEQIKVALPQPDCVLTNVTRPSDAEFRSEIKEQMARHLSLLNQSNAPFVAEIFPIEYVNAHPWLDSSFAFADNKSKTVIQDINGAVYTNIFDYLYDCFVWALRKAGAPDREIVVGQVGWPTDGYPGADAATAERFYKYLLPHVASGRGTPMRPGKPIEIFVHCLTDEPKNPFTLPFTRHWGIYRSNGEPKFKIDLSGQGRDIYPARAKGIMRMPQRWCVFNGDKRDSFKVKAQFDDACLRADCTSLSPGGSCSHLDYDKNISYAFNMYFQSMFQNETACEFGGLGEVVPTDPSDGSCVFPVEVVRGQQVNFSGAGEGLYYVDPKYAAMIFIFALSVFFVLL